MTCSSTAVFHLIIFTLLRWIKHYSFLKPLFIQGRCTEGEAVFQGCLDHNSCSHSLTWKLPSTPATLTAATDQLRLLVI